MAVSVGPVPREVVFRQPVQLSLRGLYRLCALLNVAVEFEREMSSPLMQRLQMVASGLVLVYTGQPITEQCAFDIMLYGCASPGKCASPTKIDGRKSLVDRAIQAQSARGLRHSLRFHLCLVAHHLIGGHGVQYARLRASQAELLNSRVVETQRVFRRAFAFDGQQCGQRLLVRRQARAHPGGKRLCGIGSARLPGVQVFCWGSGVNVLNRHGGQTPPDF